MSVGPSRLVQPHGRRSRSVLVTVTLVVASLAAMLLGPAVPADAREPGPGRGAGGSDHSESVIEVGPRGTTLLTDADTRPVGPGLRLTEFDRFDGRGWLRGQVLTAELAADGLHADLLHPGEVAAAQRPSQMAANAGAIAAINGDFFDINATSAPIGAAIAGGELLKGPAPGRHETVGVDRDGVGRLAEVFLEGSVTHADGAIPLTGLNQPVPAGGVVAFTAPWGSASRQPAAAGAVTELVVRDGAVAERHTSAGAGAIADEEVILVGHGTGAVALADLATGDAVEIGYEARHDGGDLRFAVGGNERLVRDGEVPALDDTVAHPRTAVGLSADGRTMYLVAVDGRQSDSRGMTLRELGELLVTLGADEAINLDGGGSSTMLAREVGAAGPTLANQPSDGVERAVPNGIGLFAAPGSGELRGLWLQPAIDVDDTERVFPGLTRRFAARGHDETYASVAAEPRWRVEPAAIGDVDGDGVFRASRPGTGRVVAQVGGVQTTGDVTVLGDLARVTTDRRQLPLAEEDATGRFRVTGYDADGFAAPIEPADVTLEYDETAVTVSPRADGAFDVRATTDSGATLVTVRVGDATTHLAVTVGLRSEVVEDFDSLDGWGVTKYPSVVQSSMTSTDGRDGGALGLDYSLTGTTSTRAAYVQTVPAYGLDLPGQPQRIGLWVDGDGNGAWLRTVIRDADGQSSTLTLASRVDWTGWRYVEATVPSGLAYPLELWRIYPVETDRNRQYEGRLVFDDLTVKVAQSVDLPPEQPVHDPAVVTDGRAADGAEFTFAVMSDAQFTADAPDSALVAGARRTMREIVAAEPDLVLINGDFTDRGTEADFDLARRLIDEEFEGQVPWHYLPGNHEINGPGTIEEFVAEFGDPWRIVDHEGVRFVQLDSSTGSFRTADFGQLVALREQLDAAEDDPAIRAVVVAGHHPPRDPSPSGNSQLGDRKEAQLVQDWLAAFQQETGKGVVYLGAHAGVFAAERVDGVLRTINGNSAKAPAGPAANGGFRGWSLYGVDTGAVRGRSGAGRFGPEGGQPDAPWLQVEMRPHVDELDLRTPATVEPGGTAAVTATVRQGEREVPVAYPVAADWSGSRELHIGDADDAEPYHVAALDPTSGELTGLRDGTVTIAVTVNEVTREADVAVGMATTGGAGAAAVGLVLGLPGLAAARRRRRPVAA